MIKKFFEKTFKVKIIPEEEYMRMNIKQQMTGIAMDFFCGAIKKLDRRRCYAWLVDGDTFMAHEMLKAAWKKTHPKDKPDLPDMLILPAGCNIQQMRRKDFKRIKSWIRGEDYK